jgi:chaperone modulatory protein CbpM
MTRNDVLAGELLDEAALTLEELAHACAVEPQWIVERVEAEILGDGSLHIAHWRFTSRDLTRARRLRQLERDFDAAPELAALTADLIEEVERLKRRLESAGLAAE